MNYIKLYLKICRSAIARERTNPPEIYERHHIFPESIYGKNDLKIKLTIREHYLVHWLLYKACLRRYGKKSIKTSKMGLAFHWMVYGRGKNNEREKINPTSRMYESARIAVVNAKREKSRPDMIGKKSFGASEERIREGTRRMSEKKMGMKINYPKNRKCRNDHYSFKSHYNLQLIY
jgi:hypothetical protein